MLDNSDKKWKKPGEGQLKVNVDAAVVEGQNFFSVGTALRDHHGQFIARKTLKIAGGVSVMEAESVGILETLIWTREVSGGSVMIESDSLLSVNAINRSQSNILELGDCCGNVVIC